MSECHDLSALDGFTLNPSASVPEDKLEGQAVHICADAGPHPRSAAAPIFADDIDAARGPAMIALGEHCPGQSSPPVAGAPVGGPGAGILPCRPRQVPPVSLFKARSTA